MYIDKYQSKDQKAVSTQRTWDQVSSKIKALYDSLTKSTGENNQTAHEITGR